jgi:hypothetical protein
MTTFDQQPRAYQARGYNLLLPSHHQQPASILHEPVREGVLLHPDSRDVALYDDYDLATAKNCSNLPHDRKLHEGVPDTEATRRVIRHGGGGEGLGGQRRAGLAPLAPAALLVIILVILGRGGTRC